MNILPFKQKTELQEWLGNDQELISFKDLIAPSIIKENYDHMELGNNICKTLVITDYPATVKGNWLSSLYRVRGNVTISYHLEPASSERMVKHLDKSIEELEARLDGSLKPRRREIMQNKHNSGKRLLSKLMQSSNSTIWKVHLYIHLTAKDLEEMEQLQRYVANVLIQAGVRVQEPKASMENGFLSVLPLQENKLAEMTYRNMDAEAVSSLFPFDESEIFEQSGLVKGINLTTGSLVLLDQFKLKNQNEFIIGSSGSGKSFYMKKDMLRHYMQGIKVFVIDPEAEYIDVIQKLGGQVITISSMSGSIINPFEIMHNNIDSEDLEKEIEEEDKEAQEQEYKKPKKSLLHQKIQRLKIFFRLIKKDLSHLEAALIESVVIETYKEKGITWETNFDSLKPSDFPILEDLYNKIGERKEERLNDFKAILETYVHGSNSLMFNGHTNVNLYKDMIAFDLKELEEESDIQPAAMYNVLSFLWDEITKDRKRKRLYVDEAHIMADPENPRPMKFLFQIYKRIRKYKGGCTAATQQIADFLTAVENKRNHGKAIIGNSTSKLLLGLENTDIADLRKYEAVKLSQEEERILKTDKAGEGIFIAGKRRVHIQVDYTPAELKLIDPKAYKKRYGATV
jgi:hypothetical protein